ncbi:hypothetical protein Lal_00006651 [Lupinus albus]|uniref:Putative oleosin n=1 Tax=Lupinus albus TaxID=3870 RepID=A0A6A4Q692_LUPAL|nr:putative oleosin [Lupinus albus]KAF1876020.1 hypothetical protein Lal_00006651 [Lupinus albus]
MAERNPTSALTQRAPSRPTTPTFLHKLQYHAPNSTQLASLFTLTLTGAILLLLTLAGIVPAFIFFSPLIIVSSPIWVPASTILFLVVTSFLSMVGFGIVAVAVLSWIYRYYRGLHPVGSDRFDYARNRIYDTASHVKDYAREYGGYLQNKVKDAAPGA